MVPAATPSGRAWLRARRKPGVKLARLAGPPLAGIPNTMNAKRARATRGGRVRARTAVGAAPTSPRAPAAATGAAMAQPRRARRKARADADPAARLGISTPRRVTQDESA